MSADFMDRSVRFTYVVLDGVRVKVIENRRLTQPEIREYCSSYDAKFRGMVVPKDGIYMFYCFERRKPNGQQR